MVGLAFILWGRAGASISIENPGLRLKPFLRELSRQSGEELYCSASLENEVLVASFQSQPIDVIRKQLGRVMHASWSESNETWLLAQTAEQKKDERQQHREARRSIIQARLDSLKKFVPRRDLTVDDVNRTLGYANGRMEGGLYYALTGDGAGKTYSELQHEKPTFRLAAALSASIRPEQFNLDATGSRVPQYFGTANLPGMSPLNAPLQPLVERFEREDALFRATYSNPKVVSPPFQLVITNDAEMFQVYDRNWKLVDGGYLVNLLSQGVGFEPEVVPLSQETKDLVKSRREYESYDLVKNYPLYKIAWEVLLHADIQDPIGILHGRCWIEYCKSKRQPLLANLSDQIVEVSPDYCIPKAKQELPHFGERRIDSDGWITAAPTDPLESREKRFDRRTIKRIAEIYIPKRSQTIAELTELDLIRLKAFLRNQTIPGLSYLPFIFQHPLTPIFGLLEPGQQSQAKSGLSIPVSRLGEPVIDILKHLRGNHSLRPLGAPGHMKQGDDYFPLVDIPDTFSGIAFEAKLDPEQFFTLCSPEDPYETTCSARNFDLLIQTHISDPNSQQWLDKLRVRVDIGATLTLRLRRGESIISDSISEVPNEKSEVYTWATLPAPIKQRILRVRNGG